MLISIDPRHPRRSIAKPRLVQTLKIQLHHCHRCQKNATNFHWSNPECVKDVKIFIWVKKRLFGCFKIEEIVTKTMKQV